MRKLRSFLGLNAGERRRVLEAIGLLACARLCLLAIPFRRIAPLLGRPDAADADEVGCDAAAFQVRRAVAIASRNAPWHAKCLAQAMAARVMLARRGVAGTVFLGVRKDAEGRLQAHAWVRCGESIVTGEEYAATFSVISSFAFGRRRRAA